MVTWGDDPHDDLNGGDSSAVQHQLKSTQHIQASDSAFAATWGCLEMIFWFLGTFEFLRNRKNVKVFAWVPSSEP